MIIMTIVMIWKRRILILMMVVQMLNKKSLENC